MATGGLKLIFDEHFSHRQVEFVWREARLALLQHTRPMHWSGLPDKDWIPLAIQQGFVIVTSDRNDKTRGYTVQDLKRMGARVIILSGFWDHLNRWEKAKWLVLTVERIVYVASAMTTGTAKLFHKNGAVHNL